jgi:hypothetical protein
MFRTEWCGTAVHGSVWTGSQRSEAASIRWDAVARSMQPTGSLGELPVDAENTGAACPARLTSSVCLAPTLPTKS